MAVSRIIYPAGLGENARRQYKEKILMNHADVLFEDTRADGSRCNLIFFTHFKEDWETVICNAYPRTVKSRPEGKIKLDLSDNKGTVCIFPSGKVLIQGTPENLEAFVISFEKLREEMQTETVTRLTKEMRLESNRETE